MDVSEKILRDLYPVLGKAKIIKGPFPEFIGKIGEVIKVNPDSVAWIVFESFWTSEKGEDASSTYMFKDEWEWI